MTVQKALDILYNWIEKRKVLFILLLFLCALVIRFSVFSYVSPDYKNCLLQWGRYIVRHGGIDSWKVPFHNYQMPYIYLLTALCYVPLKFLYAIKLLSVIFDFVAALVVFKIVKIKYKHSFTVPYMAAAVFLFLPTVIANSSVWAQCDVIYTTFLLFSGYYCLKEKSILSLLFFGIAFAFKAQAVFFAPVLLIFWYQKRFNLLYFLIIPAVYVVSVLPAFGMGRSLMDLLTIYFGQATFYHHLSMNAPNFYALIPNTYYNVVAPIGMIFSVVAVCLSVFFIIKQNKAISTEKWIEIMLFFLLLIPYILPKMHDRYFYPADVFSLLYWFYFRNKYYIPFLVIGASCFVYAHYLLELRYISLGGILFDALALLFVTSDLFRQSKNNLEIIKN